MNFRVGQKVMRIKRLDHDDEAHLLRWSISRCKGIAYPRIGDVCAIATINHWPHATLLTFREYDNSQFVRQGLCTIEPGFDAKSFRPIVERKTDISVFKKILADVSKEKEAVG